MSGDIKTHVKMYYKTDVLDTIAEKLVNLGCWEREANKTNAFEEMKMLEKKNILKTKLISHDL